MPLQTERAGDCRAMEADGSRSDMWCALCYADGKFVDPDCTLEKMVDRVDGVLRREGAGFLMRRMARKQIATLERWR